MVGYFVIILISINYSSLRERLHALALVDDRLGRYDAIVRRFEHPKELVNDILTSHFEADFFRCFSFLLGIQDHGSRVPKIFLSLEDLD